MNVIIPAAKDTEAHSRPRWLNIHPNGNMLLAESLLGLDLKHVDTIYIGVLKKHLKDFKCEDGIYTQFKQLKLHKKIKLVALPRITKNQPETVAQIIKHENISGPIFIKDVDNYFAFTPKPCNAVTFQELGEVKVDNPENKSYVVVDDNLLVTNIVEKKVISSYFCSGGYSFESAEEFLKYYTSLQKKKTLFISHIIFKMLLDGQVFQAAHSKDFIDWGSQAQWQSFRRQFSTLFIDLDGVLVKNSGEYFGKRWGESEGITENIKIINTLYDSGNVQIIITTARKEAYRTATLKQLKREGIKYHQILFGMQHAKRILINDYSVSNPYKCCDAINVRRDSDDLVAMIRDSLQVPV